MVIFKEKNASYEKTGKTVKWCLSQYLYNRLKQLVKYLKGVQIVQKLNTNPNID